LSVCGRGFRLILTYFLIHSSACWTAHLLSAFQGLHGFKSYVQAVQTGRAFPMQEFTVHWSIGWKVFGKMLGWWTMTCTTTNNRPLIIFLSQSHESNERATVSSPWSIQHVICPVSRLRLRTHTLKIWRSSVACRRLSCMISVVKMKMSRTRCTLFYFATTTRAVSWGKITPLYLPPFLKSSYRPDHAALCQFVYKLFLNNCTNLSH